MSAQALSFEGWLLAVGLLAVVAVALAAAALHRRRGRQLRAERDGAVAERDRLIAEHDRLHEKTKWERDWYRFFYKCHASWERFRTYGHANAQTGLLERALGDFVPIDRVVAKIYAPRQSDGLVGDDFLYFGSRMQALRGRQGSRLYAMSYHGSHYFAHSDKSFDSIIDLELGPRGGAIEVIAESAGLVGPLLREAGHDCLLRGKAKYFAPLSVNAADLNGDGADDFLLGGWLLLSDASAGGLRYARYTGANAPPAGRESAFLHVAGKEHLASVTGPTEVTLFKWEGAALHLAATIRLQHPIAADRPFTLLPVGRDTLFPPPDAGFIIVRDEFADVYRIDASLSAACVCSLGIGGFGEVHVGARGKFLAGDVNDLWLAEPRWKDASGATVGRLALLSATRFSTLGTGAASASSVEDVASAVIVGSARYTDYDGIGSTLSPYAGHVLGERAVPDLTFSGHRHMNEFGAVFICPGRLITEGARLSADHSEIVKIVGRPISQLAPPFVHLDVEDLNGDGHDELVVAADNDLCAGLNSGAIYVLDGKAIKDAWTGR